MVYLWVHLHISKPKREIIVKNSQIFAFWIGISALMGCAGEGSTPSEDDLLVEAAGLVPTQASLQATGGMPHAWQILEIALAGPFFDQGVASPNNPFLDHRFQMEFSHPDGTKILVPGFFDGDGVGGGMGNIWKVRFTPPKAGRWRGVASFRYGPEVAISLDPTAGTPISFDGFAARFLVALPDVSASGFYGKGALEYVGEHYLRHANGEYFLKAGLDSSENFLAYLGFNGVQDLGGLPSGSFLHDFNDSYQGGPTHLSDYQGDGPLFYSNTTGFSSEAICGALNYLSAQKMNCLYFLPMNLGGDGQDTHPFLAPTGSAYDNTHYDIGRLHQWNQIFEHAMRKGILLQFVLMETEAANENWLDNNQFGTQRKLYFRELIARFSHLPGLKWNLGEENDSLSIAELKEQAKYIQDLDPFKRSLAVHTNPNQFGDYQGVKGDANFTSTSIQYDADNASQFVQDWRAQSAAAGQKWVVDMDEITGAGLTPNNIVDLRKRVLYDVLFSGGNLEWYCGYNDNPTIGGDINMESYRSREDMWRYTWYARKFMQENLPFWQMEPADALVTGESSSFGGAEVFAKAGDVYAIYLPSASPAGSIDLSGVAGTLTLRWYNPRTGLFRGKPSNRRRRWNRSARDGSEHGERGLGCADRLGESSSLLKAPWLDHPIL